MRRVSDTTVSDISKKISDDEAKTSYFDELNDDVCNYAGKSTLDAVNLSQLSCYPEFNISQNKENHIKCFTLEKNPGKLSEDQEVGQVRRRSKHMLKFDQISQLENYFLQDPDWRSDTIGTIGSLFSGSKILSLTFSYRKCS